MSDRDANPLESMHRHFGASWTEVGGVRVVAGYRDPAREREILESGAGLVDASAMPCLVMRGEDRHRFLNGLITADVSELAVGESRYGLFATIKGRILADVTVLARDDAFWLRLPPGTGESIGEHVQKHVITDRVEVAPLEGYAELFLVGRGATTCLAQALGSEPPPEGRHRTIRLFGVEGLCLAHPSWTGTAFSLWVADSDAASLAEDLLEAEGFGAVGFEASERFRIERGLPRFGADFGPETFPQEAGLDAAVSYEKGCYLGQEVIARIHYRGGVQRRLVVLEGQGDRPPEIGETVSLRSDSDSEEQVGQVTSRTLRRGGEGWVALSMVKVRAAEPGSEVELASGLEARVAATAGVGRTVAD